MFAYLSKLLALAAMLSLSACSGLPFAGAPRQVAVAGGRVTIAAPPGYCIDSRGTHDSPAGTFVLLGSCASLTGDAAAPRPQIEAVLTAAVSAGISGAGTRSGDERLTRYFESPRGRAALSRSGRAESVTILGHHAGDDAFFLHLRDRSAFPGRPDTPESWRVLFDLNGHIVTLSVVGLPNRPIVAAKAEAILRSFMARVRAASPRTARTPATRTPAAQVRNTMPKAAG